MFSQMVSYDFLLHGALHEYFLYLVSAIVSAPPWKTHKEGKIGELVTNLLCLDKQISISDRR